MMDPRSQAMETAKDLAIQGRSFQRIERELRKLGLSVLLQDDEIEHIITQAAIARELMPFRPSRKWPRMIGMLAILLGMIALPLGGGVGRYSPAGYGIIAIILGLVPSSNPIGRTPTYASGPDPLTPLPPPSPGRTSPCHQAKRGL